VHVDLLSEQSDEAPIRNLVATMAYIDAIRLVRTMLGGSYTYAAINDHKEGCKVTFG
jgi:hypothetical protein